MAEPDWETAMQEYLDHLANLEHAVANRQQEVMLHELGTCKTVWFLPPGVQVPGEVK